MRFVFKSGCKGKGFYFNRQTFRKFFFVFLFRFVSQALLASLLPGAMGDETSALTDSFQDNLLAPPVYTRPAEFNGWRVPEVLLSGNHALIDEWQEQQALERTRLLRPDLLDE